MYKKTLTIGFWIVSLVLIVLATVPSMPTIQTPLNNTYFFDDVTLTCGGSSGADRYLFYLNVGTSGYTLVQNSTSNNYIFNTYPYTTRSDYILSGVNPTLGGGTSESDPFVISCLDYSCNAQATIPMKFESDVFFIKLRHNLQSHANPDNANVQINGTVIISGSSLTSTMTWYALDVSQYNDGNEYDLRFVGSWPGWNGRARIMWWFPPTQIDWKCAAENEDGLSDLTDSLTFFQTYFYECDSATALNLTFESEKNLTHKIDGRINSILFYLSDDSTTPYEFSFSNLTLSSSWGFCMLPPSTNVPITGNIYYSADGFPTRVASINAIINGTSPPLAKTLYLLPETDGIYTSINVVDGHSLEAIPNADIIIYKFISGGYTEITSGITDDAGSVTFFLDPTTPHRIEVTKEGYGTSVSSVTPTQSSYTVRLSSITEVDQNNYYQGILYNISPTDSILNLNQIYNFGFSISSAYWNLSSYGFQLYNSTGDLLIDVSDGISSGGLINQTFNVSTNSIIIMKYHWATDDGGLIEGNYYWVVKNTTAGDASLMVFFENLKNFNKGGVEDFTRTLIYIFFIIVILATLILFAGDSGYVEYALMFALITLIWLGEWTEILPRITPLAPQYFITIMVSLVVAAYIITDNIR